MAYVFRPDDGETQQGRAVKRRKVSKRTSNAFSQGKGVAEEFVPLLNGTEAQAAVRQREKLFTEGWDEVHGRVQVR